jgi:hypothetical protein
MKFISLLLATALVFQSASGLPVYGNGGWNHLFNRYSYHSNNYNITGSKKHLDRFYSNLLVIESELNKLNLSKTEDRNALEFFYTKMQGLLDLPQVCLFKFKQFYLPSHYKFAQAELLRVIGDAKERCSIIKSEISPLTIAKYAALIAGTVYACNYASKNMSLIKKQASELASKALASGFASQVAEVGSKISTSVTASPTYAKAAEFLKSAQQNISDIPNHVINSQIYRSGSANLAKASKQAFDLDLNNFPLI